MRFGARVPTGSWGWLVHREDGSGPVHTAPPEAYEEARSTLIRLAMEDDVPAVILVVNERGEVVREPVDR